jgi:predicted nucleic acid-binding protein
VTPPTFGDLSSEDSKQPSQPAAASSVVDATESRFKGTARVALREWHQQRAAEPIALANEAGAFPSTLIPLVFPIVVDANVIRGEIIRMARTGTRTILASAASYGVLRLYCARHVVQEIDKHCDEWADQAGLDPQLVRTVWRETYMRLLRWVDLPPVQLYSQQEISRLRVLAHKATGDPDDVPTALLALLLDAPLLSKDKKPLVAVYGEEFDYDAHTEWLDNLRAGGDLGPLGQAMRLTVIVGGGMGLAGFEGVRTIVRKVPWPILLGLIVAGSIGYVKLVSPELKRKIADGVKSVSSVSLEVFSEFGITYVEAHSTFQKLNSPSSAPSQLDESCLTNDALLTRTCLYHLARIPQSKVSAAELSQFLRDRVEIPCGEKKVRAVLRENPCFDEVYRGRFQVGRALVRIATLDPPVEDGQ